MCRLSYVQDKNTSSPARLANTILLYIGTVFALIINQKWYKKNKSRSSIRSRAVFLLSAHAGASIPVLLIRVCTLHSRLLTAALKGKKPFVPVYYTYGCFFFFFVDSLLL